MKKALVVVSLLAFAALAQTRTDDYSAADVAVTEIVLTPLPDAGCAARWGGAASSSDGGATVSAVTPSIDLKAPINQSRCSALANAGVNRLANQLRFAVDAGVP